MMRRKKNFYKRKYILVPIILLCISFFSCDSKKEENPVQRWIDCQLIKSCYQENTRFGMIGDSWTDFAFGTSIQRDLYDWLVLDHDYKINATNIAGQTLANETNLMKSYLRIIKNSGPNIHYMLVSLGGNDLLDSSSEYKTLGIEVVKNQRFTSIQSNLTSLIIQGSAYKVSLYGGKPLKWVIHGYDYTNPEFPKACPFSGFTLDEKRILAPKLLDDYNQLLIGMAATIPDLHYIDLRATLGGPPTSNPSLKYDCIHPNEVGFQLLANRYATSLQLLTQER